MSKSRRDDDHHHGSQALPINAFLMMVLICGIIDAAPVQGAETSRKWRDDTYSSYFDAHFDPIDGSFSWGLITDARYKLCREDTTAIALLKSINARSNDPAKVWLAIAAITANAVSLEEAAIDSSGLTPQQWKEQFPLQARFSMHSGHWWDYWNRLAQLARWAYSDPYLEDLLDPGIMPLLTEMEAAFLPYLVVAPELGPGLRPCSPPPGHEADTSGDR